MKSGEKRWKSSDFFASQGLKQQKTWRSEQTSLSSNTLRRRGSVLAADTFGGKKDSTRKEINYYIYIVYLIKSRLECLNAI